MILELTFNNYRLFKNANTLSFKADKRTRHLLSNSTPIDGVNVLKALAIYGSNNSGKTNIVSLFEMMKSILASDNNIVCNREIFGDTGETSFSVVFDNKDGKGWLRYEGSYDSETKTFPYEKLSSLRYYNTSTRDKTIFERHLSEKRLTVLGEDKERHNHSGGIQLLTHNEISRIDLTEYAFIMALTKYINGEKWR